MTRTILLDLCLDQDRLLDGYLRAGAADPDWLDQAATAYLAHADLIGRAHRHLAGRDDPDPDGGAAELLAGVVRNALAHGRGILAAANGRPLPPEQAAEVAGAFRRLAGLLAAESTAPTREQALELFRAGRALELDAAFAQIAGVSAAEWAARVAAHRRPAARPIGG